MSEQPATFTHRVFVHKVPMPVCADCGAPSKYTLRDVSVMGRTERSFLEQPLNECPNGPHPVYLEKED